MKAVARIVAGERVGPAVLPEPDWKVEGNRMPAPRTGELPATAGP